jgi:hypothetical protein
MSPSARFWCCEKLAAGDKRSLSTPRIPQTSWEPFAAVPVFRYQPRAERQPFAPKEGEYFDFTFFLMANPLATMVFAVETHL